MDQHIQTIRKKINNLLTVNHIIVNVVGDSSVEQHHNKIRCYCPIHGEKLFRTLTIDIDDRTFKCSYTMCKAFQGGDLMTLYCMVTHTSIEEATQFWAAQLGLEHPMSAGSKETEKSKITLSQKAARTAMIPFGASPKLSKDSTQNSIFDFVQREIDRTLRYKRSLSLILIEFERSIFEQKTIDSEFRDKFFNAVIEVIVGTIRVADAWARYDDDQYVVLLPETEQDNAEIVIKKLKASVLKYCKANPNDFPFQAEEIQNRLNVGIASISASEQNTKITAEVLFERAQQYLKKQDFRRSVTV